MAKYTQAVLHANGETVTLATPADAKNLRALMKSDGMNFFTTSDGAKEIGVTTRSSQFVELTIDQATTPLAPKPNCDNYGDCSSPVIKGGDVTVKYVDEAEAPTIGIVPDVIISGNVGDAYTTEQKTIEGYTFKEVQGSATGTIKAQEQTVLYVYTKNAE